MKLKGVYNPEETYSAGDVVLLDSSGDAYLLREPAKSGVPPTDTQHWSKLDSTLSECAQLIVSCMAVPSPTPTPAPTRTKKK